LVIVWKGFEGRPPLPVADEGGCPGERRRESAQRGAQADRRQSGKSRHPHQKSTMVLIQNHRAFSILVDIYTAI